VVSSNGTQIIPDPDPNYPGHGYGLVHFDWHGPATPPPNGNNPGSCGPSGGDPCDISSGLEVLQATDITINGARGPISINRVYRSGSTNPGPFGIGTGHNYSYELNTA